MRVFMAIMAVAVPVGVCCGQNSSCSNWGTYKPCAVLPSTDYSPEKGLAAD